MRELLSPASAVSLLPGKAAKPEDTGEAVAPALASCSTSLVRRENALDIGQAEWLVEHAYKAKVSPFGKGFRL